MSEFDSILVIDYERRQREELDAWAESMRRAPARTEAAPAAEPTKPEATEAPEKPGVIGGAVKAATDRFLGGAEQVAGAIVPPPGAPERSAGGRVLDAATGLLNTVLPLSAAAGHLAGEGWEAMVRSSGELTDEAIRRKLEHAKQHTPNEVPALVSLLAIPEEERIQRTKEGASMAGEFLAGMVPGYTGAAAGARTLMRWLAPEAKAARLIEKAGGKYVGTTDLGDGKKFHFYDVEVQGGTPTTSGAFADEMSAATLKKQIEDTRAQFASVAREVPSPNVARTGMGDEARAIVLDINQKLEASGQLARSKVVTHEQTKAAAGQSQFRSVEDVLNLDTAAVKAEDLAATQTAARGVRDKVLEDLVETMKRAEAGDAQALTELRQRFALAGEVSRKVTDLQTHVARGLESAKIISESTIAKQYDLNTLSAHIRETGAAIPLDDQALLVALKSMATDAKAMAKLADQSVKAPSAFKEIYYGLNLLSAPVTHTRNILGNTAALVMGISDRAFGEIIAAPFRIVGKSGTQHVAGGETFVYVASLWSNVANAFRAARRGIRTGESTFGELATSKFESLGRSPKTLWRTAEEGGTAGAYGTFINSMVAVARANRRFMESTDEFFKVLQFRAELDSLAYRAAAADGLSGPHLGRRVRELVDRPSESMLRQAKVFAEEQTFTKAFQAGTLGASAEQLARHPAMAYTVVPFFRTPTRLLEYSSVHTPGLNLLAKQFYSDIGAGGAKAEVALGKLATGGAMVGMTWWLASIGYVTGAPPRDPKLRASYERAGWQPYSLYNPATGKYHSYQGLEPITTVMGAVATAKQFAQSLGDEASMLQLTTAAILAAAKTWTNNPFMQGMSDIGDVVEGMARGEDVDAMLRAVANRLAALVPGSAVLGAVARSTDDTRRETQIGRQGSPLQPETEWREFQKLLAGVQAKVPGWSATRPAKRNMITGEPVPHEGHWLAFVNPFQMTTVSDDTVLRELVDLDGAGLPREVPRVIAGTRPADGVRIDDPSPGQGIRLSDEERDRLTDLLTSEVTISGKTLHEYLGEEITSANYQRQSDGKHGGKALRLKTVFNAYLDMAEAKLIEEHQELRKAIQLNRLNRDLLKMSQGTEGLQEQLRQLVR